MRGNLGLLNRTPAIPAEEQTDILTDMVDESDRLIRLVNDLLVLACADAGRNLVKEPVAILPVLDEACHQARQRAPQRNITLTAPHDLSDQVPSITPEIAAWYELKESFRDLFNQPLDYKSAENLLLDWVSRLETCKYKSLVFFAKPYATGGNKFSIILMDDIPTVSLKVSI